MRIILGYDGSTYADAALRDLDRAGLPAETEAVVLSAADIWPSRPEWMLEGPAPDQERRMSLPDRAAYELALYAMQRARAAARDGEEKLRRLLPAWHVAARARAGPPAGSLITEATQQSADLVVLGSRGTSLLPGLLLGGVSRRVVAHAPCSVRIGRVREDREQGSPVRLLLGMDGSANARLAANSVASRQWPAGSTMRIIATLDTHLIMARSASARDRELDARTWVTRICGDVARELIAAGLSVDVVVEEGDAAAALVDVAESFDADCVFVGATGLRGLERFVIGSVSRTVAEQAPCSVEVVRPSAL
jgi:nucleotide-binding universal stress UspA family protein